MPKHSIMSGEDFGDHLRDTHGKNCNEASTSVVSGRLSRIVLKMFHNLFTVT